MSERTTTRRPARRKPRALPVYLTSAALFVGMFGFLGVRVADGQDPVLGTGKQWAAAPAVPHKVVVRRVVVTKRIVIVKRDRPATGASGGAQLASSAPVTQSSTPAYSAPAYTPPAAAPAPVQSSTS